ncbi:hypothetical protein CLAIMM_03079 isoform 2 [Cladophialophora immunda]|nr:hypothetical protein CLAIMM_03079 isoform 2 [Cladophialophora immunda]
MSCRHRSCSHEAHGSYGMGFPDISSNFVIVVSEPQNYRRQPDRVLRDRPRKCPCLLGCWKRKLFTSRPMPSNGVVVSVVANSKNGGVSMPGFQDVRMFEDAAINPACCLISESTAARLRGKHATDQLADPWIVETSDGRKYRCVQKLEARWTRARTIPETEAITLYIAPDLPMEALFCKGVATNRSSSSGCIATIEGPPQTPGMFYGS